MSGNTMTLVLGGTGKTGRRIVDRLTAHGVPVRVGSRAGAPPFDWADRATWAAVLSDVDAVYVSYFPDLAVAGATDDIRAFTELAVSTGVRRLVLLSGRGEEEAQASEKVVQDAGAEWTIIRASWFSQNFSESYLLEPVLAGEVVLPTTGVAEPFVDADDIADVAVAALTETGHASQVYELTGPRLLTFADAVGEIAAATGRPIRFVPVSATDYAAALTSAGVPGDVVSFLTYLFTTVLDGRNAQLADGVQRALGRPPRDFADYCRDVAASGLWTG
ncbi:NAD(P)H-binding protein [Micromonospora sp. CPCC 205556]|uniref:NAD(P)H-binding protein n=1 Tax=Micromonospora sp. CPCC 205556 TaxID=3122398 RepID=UPI002FF09D4E